MPPPRSAPHANVASAISRILLHRSILGSFPWFTCPTVCLGGALSVPAGGDPPASPKRPSTPAPRGAHIAPAAVGNHGPPSMPVLCPIRAVGKPRDHSAPHLGATAQPADGPAAEQGHGGHAQGHGGHAQGDGRPPPRARRTRLSKLGRVLIVLGTDLERKEIRR